MITVEPAAFEAGTAREAALGPHGRRGLFREKGGESFPPRKADLKGGGR
jgi:hypothetical protein